MDNNDPPPPRCKQGAGMSLGIGVGVAVGVALGQLALGIAIGVAIGGMWDSIQTKRR